MRSDLHRGVLYKSQSDFGIKFALFCAVGTISPLDYSRVDPAFREYLKSILKVSKSPFLSQLKVFKSPVMTCSM